MVMHLSGRRRGGTIMIARTWRGATRAEDADAYLRYLHETGFAQYRSTPGNLGVLGLRRMSEGRAEFFLLTLWESEEAIHRFAGDDIGRAVFYPQDQSFLVEKEDRVSHFEVVFQEGWEGGPR
jgi:heme-degrading monooxygenase HmoA